MKYTQLTKWAWLLILAIIVLLGATTFIEQLQGTEYVSAHIYHTWWFCGC